MTHHELVVDPASQVHDPELEQDKEDKWVSPDDSTKKHDEPEGKQCGPVHLGKVLRAEERWVAGEGGGEERLQVEAGEEEVLDADPGVEEEHVEGAAAVVVGGGELLGGNPVILEKENSFFTSHVFPFKIK